MSDSGSVQKAPLCSAGQNPVSVETFWGTQWRADQKEPLRRELAALKGIQRFLDDTDCLKAGSIKRMVWAEQPPSNDELLRSVSGSNAERVLFIAVRELGPTLAIGVPVVLAGGTEVVLDVRLLDTQSTEVLADTTTSWSRGGTFVIKGTKSLDRDLAAALRSVLLSDEPANGR